VSQEPTLSGEHGHQIAVSGVRIARATGVDCVAGVAGLAPPLLVLVVAVTLAAFAFSHRPQLTALGVRPLTVDHL